MATIKPRRGTSTPGTGAIIQNELAVDTTNKRIFIGAANGSGTLIGSAPAGSDTQIQFNDGGFLGGDAGLTFNKTTDDLTIGGDLNVNGGDIFTTQTTVTVFNTTATTVNAFGAATTLTLGATSGTTTTIRGGTLVGNQATQNVFNTTATTVNAFGAATSLTIGDVTTATTTIRGGTIVGNTTTQNVFNTAATTVNAFGSANAVIMGSTTATITLRGGTVVGSETTQNVFNSVATTINAFGGATTACNVGPTTGSMTLRPPIVTVGSGNATIKGASAFTVNAANGNLNLTVDGSATIGGSRSSIVITNSDQAAGEIRLAGGNVYLGRKTADDLTFTSVDLVFEGSVDDTNETTLTVTNPTADRTITLPDATGTVALTANNLSVFAATTSAQLAGVINDETGFTSGALLVFNTSPSFTTSVVTGSASFDVFNTTATTLNAFGAATTLSIGYNSTAASTTNISTGAVAAFTTKTINIGTGGAASSTTNINIGSSNGGTLTSNCPMVSPRLARVSSSAFDTRTGSFSPADTDNGKVFVINISGKTTATVTLDSLSVGWRARFLILGGSGVTFTSTGGTVFGSFGTGGLGNSALTEVVEVYCYATNAYIAS